MSKLYDICIAIHRKSWSRKEIVFLRSVLLQMSYGRNALLLKYRERGKCDDSGNTLKTERRAAE